MVEKFKLIGILFAVFLFSGCASIDQKSDQKNVVRSNYQLKHANSPFANAIRLSSEGSNFNNLEVALRLSLQQAGLYARKPNEARFVLTPRIVEEVGPSDGFKMSGFVTVEYTLEDLSLGPSGFNRIVFRSRLRSEFSAGLGDKIWGTDRSAFVITGYIQENIGELFNLLDNFSPRVATRDLEIKRKKDADQAVRFLVQEFSVYDVFSSNSFQSAYPSNRYHNYSMRDIISQSWPSLLTRLRNASIEDLKAFMRNYSSDLLEPLQKEVEIMIQKKESPKPPITRDQPKRNFVEPPKAAPRSRSGGLPPLPLVNP